MKDAKEAVSAKELQNRWGQFVESGNPTARHFLIEHHLPLVRAAAHRMHRRLNRRVELGDLVSAGTFGLMEAVDSFDPVKGVPFYRYSARRIAGAMIDELRRLDFLPRSVRHDVRFLDEARQKLFAKLGFNPNSDELATHLKKTPGDLALLESRCRAAHTIPASDNDLALVDKTTAQDRPKKSLQELLGKRLLSLLSATERMILTLYYLEEQTLKEIGARLNFSECWICQLHARALKRLHDADLDPALRLPVTAHRTGERAVPGARPAMSRNNLAAA